MLTTILPIRGDDCLVAKEKVGSDLMKFAKFTFTSNNNENAILELLDSKTHSQNWSRKISLSDKRALKQSSL